MWKHLNGNGTLLPYLGRMKKWSNLIWEYEEFNSQEVTILVNTMSTIGNAYKTIMARISRSKSADSDVSDADRSNAAKALASVNISTYDNKGNFKDLEEILDELSGKWKNLSDAQR